MNKKILPYLYTLFFATSIHGIFGQEFSLKLAGKDSLETDILQQVVFQKEHASKKSIHLEISSTHEKIKKLGYFTSTLTKVTQKENTFTALFSLGQKIEEITIIVPDNIKQQYSIFNNSPKRHLKTTPQEIENIINNILIDLDKQGKSFSEVKFKNPVLQGSSLTLELKIDNSSKRTISKVIVNGYREFPSSFIDKYYKIDTKTIFSKNKLQNISLQTRNLDFVEEIKPPEVLFKKDSTILYLFLKRVKTSSIDGIINFASKEDGNGLLINGNLDLKLNNVLHTGESFNLYWNRIKEESSEFKLSTDIPYIFNTAFSAHLNFNIYRQDSTFLNTRFQTELAYQINTKSKAAISYASENSDYLIDTPDMLFDSFSSSFWGLAYDYFQPSKKHLFNTAFSFRIHPSYGQRKGDTQNSNQLRGLLSSEFNISLTNRSYLNLKNQTGFLESDNYLTNELFRIGGANSIRGFNEQSIFTNRYSYANLEYRYVTSNSSYLHSITDFGAFKNIPEDKVDTVLGLGIGYAFSLKNNSINLGYAIGLNSGNDSNFNNSKIIISWRSNF